MISQKLILKSRFFLTLILCLTLGASSLLGKHCQTSIELVNQTTLEDWDRRPPNLAAILLNNSILLFGVEAARSLQGWPDAFEAKGFGTNTVLDIVMTAITSRVQTGQVPAWIPNSLRELGVGKRGFIGRATLNTFISTALTLGLWIPAAAATGNSIDAGEAAGAFGLCAGFYFCIQAFAQTVFIKIPRRLDGQSLKLIEANYGSEFAKLIDQAQAHAAGFHIPKEQVYDRLLSAIDRLVFEIKFEQRLRAHPDFLKDLPYTAESWRIIDILHRLEKPARAFKPHPDSRKDLVHEFLVLADRHPELREPIANILRIDPAMSPDESLAILSALDHRGPRTRWVVRAAATAHQILGALAGGFLLRTLTQNAISD